MTTLSDEEIQEVVSAIRTAHPIPGKENGRLSALPAIKGKRISALLEAVKGQVKNGKA